MLARAVALCVSLLFTSSLPSGRAQTGRDASATGGSNTAGNSSGLTAGLSTACQAAAGALVSSELSKCANVIGLVSLVGSKGDVVDGLSTWISGLCSSPECSQSALKSAGEGVSSGCAADLQANVTAAVALGSVISNYNGIRNMLCTQYTSNGTYCVPSIMDNIQTATHKNFSLSDIQAVVSGSFSALPLASVPAGAYCTDCGHALVTQSNAITVKTDTSNVTSSSAGANDLAKTCGGSFGDNKLPSTVRVATSGSSNAKNAAGSQLSNPLPALCFLAVLGAASSLSTNWIF